MSNVGLIIEERSRDIGDFLVGRYIPFRKKRMVGPFIFVDHMGPEAIGPGHYLDIGQHPHIGLSTLTYLFEGEVMHRDSLGTEQRIRPGSVNWMTAGRGIVHTERTPQDQRDGGQYPMHGFQIWVALPKELEAMEPKFFHLDAAEVPRWHAEGLRYALVAGEGFGRKSPLPVYSDLFLLEIHAEADAPFLVEGELKGEIGITVIEGALEACGERIEKGNLLVSKEDDVCKINVEAGSHLLVFGGQPFAEPRHIYWNFVASELETIEEAKRRWAANEFKAVPGEQGRIPLPG